MADRRGNITTAIVCEDIRQEQSNQSTLVGVYAGDIVTREFPASIRVAVYIEYVIASPAEHDVRFRISYQGAARHEIMDARMRVPGTAKDGIAFALPATSLRINEAGSLIVEASFDDGQEWVPLIAKRVEKGAVPSARGSVN